MVTPDLITDNKAAIIQSPLENKRVLITPMEDESLIEPPTTGMLNQAEFVINNRNLEEELYNEKMKTLSMQTSRQLRESFNIDNQQRLIQNVNDSLQYDSTEVVALGLEAISNKRRKNEAALEEEFIKAVEVQAEKNPVSKYIMDNDKSFFSGLVQDSKKQLAISNKLEEIKNRSDWADTGLNLVSEVSMTSFLQRSFGFGLFDYASELRELQKKLEVADADDAIRILDDAENVIKATQILGKWQKLLKEAKVAKKRQGL